MIYTCFYDEYVLLGSNFDFLGGFLAVTARYLMVTACYCSLPGDYYSLLVVAASYRSLLLVPTFSVNDRKTFLYPLYIKQIFLLWHKKKSPNTFLLNLVSLLTFGTERKQCLLSLSFWKHQEKN